MYKQATLNLSKLSLDYLGEHEALIALLKRNRLYNDNNGYRGTGANEITWLRGKTVRDDHGLTALFCDDRYKRADDNYSDDNDVDESDADGDDNSDGKVSGAKIRDNSICLYTKEDMDKMLEDNEDIDGMVKPIKIAYEHQGPRIMVYDLKQMEQLMRHKGIPYYSSFEYRFIDFEERMNTLKAEITLE